MYLLKGSFDLYITDYCNLHCKECCVLDYTWNNGVGKNITNSGVSEIVIERSSKKCTVSIHTSRPGFVIGKKGSDIEKIKKNYQKLPAVKFQ